MLHPDTIHKLENILRLAERTHQHQLAALIRALIDDAKLDRTHIRSVG